MGKSCYRVTFTKDNSLSVMNVPHDPYTPDRHYYECRNCLQRFVTDESRTTCPECGARLQNIAIPRE